MVCVRRLFDGSYTLIEAHEDLGMALKLHRRHGKPQVQGEKMGRRNAS